MNLCVQGSPIVFDVYVPGLCLAFEYNGYQHYYNHFMFGDVKSHKERDKARQIVCEALGITVIEIPYWWSGQDKESIIAALHKIRPDILLLMPQLRV